MVVFKSIPLWFSSDINICIYNNRVAVDSCFKPIAVIIAHHIIDLWSVLNTTILYLLYSFVCNGRVTNADKELDAFFSFELLKLSVLFQEFLLILAKFDIL